ncbi:MAG: GGDEF domain-containing phosphodiesterase [Chitinivibrionia bacterium]|nr:GGDEF domain-containing phosphodiesterase [Chitinivibrionia bacterium]
MNQTLWMKAIYDNEKQPLIYSLFHFRLHLVRVILCVLSLVAVIIGALTFIENHDFNLFAPTFVLISSVAGVIFLLIKPKKLNNLCALIPLFTLFSAEILNSCLIRIYGEIFTTFYIVQIALNYLLCSSRVGLAYSLITALAVFVVYAENGFVPQVFGIYWSADIVLLLAATILGFFVSKRYEKNSKKEDIRKNTDEFTGLLNATGFVRELKKATETLNPFYVIFVDVYKFHELDDNIGSTNAEKVLKLIAQRLATIPKSSAHARFYNDRFSFVSSAENALVLTAHLEEFEKDVNIKYNAQEYSSGACKVAFSSGIVHYPEQASDIGQLLNFAEISLDKSKSNKFDEHNVFFIREYLDDKKRLNTIKKDLFSACISGELQVYYQPKVSLVNKTVTGMEALSRWTHPSLGYISPEQFVSIAEKSGHITTLGEYVIESAFYHIKQTHKMCSNDITVSINISPIQLSQSNFADNILARAKNFDVDPQHVYLEITEGTMLRNDSQTILKRLKDIGFNLSLDDFGTGYSSLNYLYRYNFDELKIDKSFTDGLMRGKNERVLFKFLISLAKDIGMKTVTEGVEDEVQIKLLQGLGAEEIQGWYYSKALSSFDCIEYIRNFHFNDDEATDAEISDVFPTANVSE